MKQPLLFIPGPVTVSEAVLRAAAQPMIDHRGPEFSALLRGVSERLKPIFGTQQGEIVLLGSSGTGALEAAITSCFSAGDMLLAAPVGVFGRRMIAIAQMYGMHVEIVGTDGGHALDPQSLIDRLAAERSGKYAGVLLTQNETSTGVQNDMAAIAPAIRKHGALSIVDSISALAATEIRMDEWGYDVVVGASQKALAAPPGVAMVALSPRAKDVIAKSKTPRFYFDLKTALQFASDGQLPWTAPVGIVAALDAALEIYEKEGAESAFRRHAKYAQAIRAAFDVLGLQIFSVEGAHSPTVVAAHIPRGVEAVSLLRKLREERGVVLSGGQAELRGKILRMGTMGAITQTDVLGAIGAIEMALLELELPVSVGEAVKAALSVFLDVPARRGDAQKTHAQMAAQTTETLR